MNYYRQIKIGYMSKKFNLPLFLIGSLLSTLTLKDLIGDGVLGSNTKMVLVNAIYFKGEWETKFLERNTFRYQFQISNNETAEVDMMYNSGEYAHIYIPELKAVFLNLVVIYTFWVSSLKLKNRWAISALHL